MIRTEIKNTENFSHVILDTNIIIEIKKILDESVKDYRKFFNSLENNGLEPTITKTVYFEFLRSAEVSSVKGEREDYLDSIVEVGGELPLKENYLEELTEIGNVYSNIGETDVEMGDYMIAFQLKTFYNNSILATKNLKDFPEVLFNRKGYCFYDTLTREIDSFYFLEFNYKNYQEILSDVKSN